MRKHKNLNRFIRPRPFYVSMASKQPASPATLLRLKDNPAEADLRRTTSPIARLVQKLR
jgi:hypothetical protein